MIIIFSVCFFVGFMMVILALQANLSGTGTKSMNYRINRYIKSTAKKTDETLKLERRNQLSAVPLLNQILLRIRKVSEIHFWLKQSGLKLSTGAFVSLVGILAIGSYFILASMNVNALAALGLSGFCGASAPYFIQMKRKKRMRAFAKAFPDAISKMSSSLKAGYSLQMALESVVHDTKDIVSDEFKHVAAQIEVGQNFESSLEKMLERMDTPDLRLFIASVSIQRESGGNLTEILDNLESTIRERFQLMEELESATAQGKLSGMVMGGLPIFVGTAVFMINPDYIKFFFDDPVGKNLFWASVFGQIIGFLVIRKIVTIEM